VDPVEHIRDYSDNDYIYVTWNIKESQIVNDSHSLKKTKWPRWSLSNAINARYLGNLVKQQEPALERELQRKEKCRMTAVNRFNDELNASVAGSSKGDLYLFRFDALYVDPKSIRAFKTEELAKADMSLARGFSAHTSMVICTEIYQTDHVFSSALSDQCIVQWKLEYEDQEWELDYNNIDQKMGAEDPYEEVPSEPNFKILVNDIWQQRLEINSINNDIEP
jgi:hypothetical protein